MGSIRVLPPAVAAKIAAGEVVERPASVVKELVENALDAGAGRIEIEVEDGGRGRIRVADDGSGIEPDDAENLFKPHATSKVSTPEDLAAIRSLGFRGEALHSIGAVSEVRLDTRARGRTEGIQVRCRAGATEPPRPAACPEGTTVEVRRLFFNVPARRKFLRSAPVEFDHIRETLVRFALGRPDVGFRLSRDGRPEVALPPGEDLVRRQCALVPSPGVGPWYSIEAEFPGGRLSGLLAPPACSRTNASGVYTFVNDRFVRDRILLKAVQEGYHEFLVPGRRPVVILFLQVPAGQVDVNVHPAKSEIRFSRPGAVFDFVAGSIRDRLLRMHRAVSVVPRRTETREDSAGERLSRFFQASPAPPPAEATRVDSVLPGLVTGRKVFQLHRKYLIEETEDGILIVDQHALHERVMLEELRKSYASAELPRQRLLAPPSVEVSGEQMEALERHRRLLQEIGFGFEPFGRRTVRLTSVPSILRRTDPAGIFRDLLETLSERRGSGVEEVLEQLACHSAIRFGDRLSDEEIEELLRRRDLLENPHVCAHGRPVAIRLSLDDLERYFKRK